jgi:hypothetical protein
MLLHLESQIASEIILPGGHIGKGVERVFSTLDQHDGDEVGNIRSHQQTTHHTRNLAIQDKS